jgi:long-chain acyl-CoA synthetase
LGNARAGTRIVPLNWHLTPSELAALLSDSGAKLLVVGPGLDDLGAEAADLAGVSRVLTMTGAYPSWLDDAGDQLLAAGSAGSAGSTMLFTGGTTGRSKGVIRSDHHVDIENWSKIWSGWASLVKMPTTGITLITTPVYHALGLAVMTASLSRGMPVVMTERFDPEVTLGLIEEHRITSTTMVPTQFVRLLKLDSDIRHRHDLSSMQWILHSAAPCPPWVKRSMIDWFGPVIYEMYGSSEGTGPAICDSKEWLERPGTVGRASARVTYSIVDEDGNDLPAGEVGTIYCRRTDGAPEYHDDPEKTEASRLPDGRFTVGDLGWLDEDGYLFLADRRVDLIITGGSNVYPAEIEAVLVEHPSITDVAVFGIPDPDWGQRIMAVIEPAPRTMVDLDDVREFAGRQLAAYKIPRDFEIVETLPREAHGKLKKRLLRDPYWDQEPM